MNKYLIELIKLQSSVILPGFGSLMIGNSKTGKIVFNPHLKFNDGALAKFISEKEGIDQQTAQNQIAKFVREIDAELGKGNSFGIFQLGKFVKNTKGEVEFVHEGEAVMQASETQKQAAAKESKPQPEKKTEPSKTESKPEEKKTVETKKESAPTTASESKKASESLIDKLKSAEKEDIKKLIPAEDTSSKQIKNIFKPSDTKSEPLKEQEKSKTEEKPVEVSKNIPLAEASKKDPAAQEKNVFKPSDAAKKETEKSTAKVEEKLVAASDAIKSESSDKKPKTATPMKEEEKPKMESVKEKFRKDKPQKVKHENPEGKKPKKKKSPMVWIILIIIVGGGATAGWFYKDQIKHFLFAGVGEHEKDSTQTVTPHDSTATAISEEFIEDSTAVTDMIEESTEITEEVIEKPVEEVKDKPAVNNTSPGGTYHIIGNSFSSETNADNYVNTMNAKGYSARNIGKYSGLYLVSIKSFGSRDEAKSNLSSVQSDAPGAYVFKGK